LYSKADQASLSLIRSPWLILVFTGAALLIMASGLAFVSTRFTEFAGWGSFLIGLIIGAGLLLLGWFAIRSDQQLEMPRWLGWLIVGAALFRLAVGVFWFIALPVWGYGSPVEQSGYVMADAAGRDTAAWELAQSGLPLVRAFEGYRLVDQYGGLLFLSALFYRYLGGGVHQPLQIVVLTASFSALAVLFTWAFVRRAWGERPAKFAAWIVALFPEAVLLGSSQMREAFTMTLVAACAYGLVRYHQERSWGGLGWVMAGLAVGLLFSPPFAGLVLVMLIVLALSMDGWHVFRQRRLWLILAILAVVIGLGIWLSWERIAPAGMTNPLMVIGWWLKQAAKWQAYLTQRASGWVQKIFKTVPDWTQIFLLLGLGVLQPFLPAALLDQGIPIWRGVAIWRAIGWSLVLPFLIVAPFLAIRRAGWQRGLAVGLSLVVWWGILLASLRSGGDFWDNPRYRVAFISLQVALVVWVLWEERQRAGPWLRWAVVGLGLILVWFLPWYLDRNTVIVWPIGDVFKTLGLGVASAVLYVVWDWARTKDRLR
jgi:hypothetical protein